MFGDTKPINFLLLLDTNLLVYYLNIIFIFKLYVDLLAYFIWYYLHKI